MTESERQQIVCDAQCRAVNLACEAAMEMTRPSMMLRPRLFIEGDQWCALYGENLQDGVAGFGDTPDEAFRAFDVSWFQLLADKVTAEAEERTP